MGPRPGPIDLPRAARKARVAMSFSLSRPWAGLLALSLYVAPLGAIDGCGGDEFSAATAGDASVDGRAGGAGTAGRGGTSGSSGKGGAAAGGTAGRPDASGTGGAAACAQAGCPAGEYCNSDSFSCQTCSDVARFRFGTPEKIDSVSATQELNQRFPRVTQQGIEMFFRAGDGAHTLWVTPDFTRPGAQVSFGPNVNVANQSSSAPLEVTWRLPNGSTYNFVFDRTVAGPDSRRMLMVGQRTAGATVGTTVALPPPFNTDATTPSSNYSIAVASTGMRAWWMTTRSGSVPELVTSPLTAGSTTARVDIPLEGGCARTGPDATPWTPQDGAFLLFSAQEHGASCSAPDSARNLHVMVMAPSGQPALPVALELSDVNTASWDDTDPSMSADLCWLYFASNEGTADYDVFRAPRR